MNYTNDNTFDDVSKSVENTCNLINELKEEVNKSVENIDSKKKIDDMINQVSEILTTTEEPEEKKILLISNKTQTVILPYDKKQINKFIEEGKYKTQEEVIQQEYTIPLSRYKNQSFSRLREAYKLARKQEKYTAIDSFKYAINLFFERRLHPAVITACKTIDELDIYLACLDEDVTELFDFFDVVFEYPPSKVNS